MNSPLRFCLASVFAATLLAAGCSSKASPAGSGGAMGGTGSGGSAGSGGSTAAMGSGGSPAATGGRGSGGVAGSGGSSSAVSGGSTGNGGIGGGAAGSGGSSSVSSGGATGTGGNSVATGGGASGGVPASGGAGGSTVGSGGRVGSGGTGSGGTGVAGASGTGTGGATVASGDDFVSDVKVAVHPNTNTILVVTWTQLKAADNTLLEFSFTGSSVMTSRAQAGATGAHRDVVLGVPEKTAVTVRVVSKLGGVDYKTKDYQGTTGAIPSGMPKPTLVAYDATLASSDRYLFGSVEDSVTNCGSQPCDYLNPFWIYILDRQGRIVWYWADPSSGSSHAFPRVARDGEYIVIDTGRSGETTTPTGALGTTLDRQYYQFVAIPGIDDAIDVTSDGSVLYDADGKLRERNKQGTIRDIWTCPYTKDPGADPTSCYCNAVNWVPSDDTVLMSFPSANVVAQISRSTGALVGQYGNAPGSYAFVDATWKFQFQHGPTITPQGTLLVSSHLPDYPYGSTSAPYHHAFEEFDIDRTNKKLTQKWIYKDGKEWAESKGMALRLVNGNTLVNYGNGGVIREVTTDKKTAFEIKFDAPIGDDFHNNMVGNNVFVDDLYALNGGGPK